MALPLYKAEKILAVGGFNADLMKEAKEAVGAAKVVEDTEIDEDLKLPEIP